MIQGNHSFLSLNLTNEITSPLSPVRVGGGRAGGGGGPPVAGGGPQPRRAGHPHPALLCVLAGRLPGQHPQPRGGVHHAAALGQHVPILVLTQENLILYIWCICVVMYIIFLNLGTSIEKERKRKNLLHDIDHSRKLKLRLKVYKIY